MTHGEPHPGHAHGPHDHPHPPHEPTLDFRRRTIYIVTLAAGVAAVLFLLWWLRWVFSLTFLAILLAVFLRGGADLLAYVLRGVVRLSHGTSLALFCLLILGLGTAFVMLAVPSLSAQVDALSEQLPASYEHLKDRLRQTEWGSWLLEQSGLDKPGQQAGTGQEATTGSALVPSGQAVARQAAGWAGSLVTAIVVLFFVIFAALYMAAEPGLYKRGILWLVPPRGRKKADCVLDRVAHTLKFWLMGQLAAMTAVGLFIGVGLWILGAPVPLVGGVLAALLEFVPNVGPAIAAGIPTLLALPAEGRFLAGPQLAAAVLGLFLVVQMAESYLMTPLIQRRAVELPPALLIVTQLAAAVLLGPLGVVIAAPLVASAMAATRELFVVGDPGHEHPKDRSHEGDKA